jgi:metallo-beta-lactamase class B
MRELPALLRRLLSFVLLAPALQAAEAPPAGLPPAPGYAISKNLFESWKPPIPPRRLVGNIYYVGASGISSFLITTPAGHVLLDTGFDETVPLIQRSVEQLGFKVADIKFILGSHAHADHTGGHAAMQQLTGAQVVSSAADARLLADGGANDYSPFPAELMRYPPAKADRIVRDGDTVTLGGVTLTAHLTPGHTRGATTWTMDVRDGDTTRPVVFFSSTSIVASTSLVKRPAYPEIVADYRSTFAKLKSLRCEIWFSPHGAQFGLTPKLAALERGETPNPFIDPAAWQKLLAAAEQEFLRQLELENKL